MLDHKSYSPDEFGYAVFGRVLEGMDVVDKIGTVPTGIKGEHEDVPATPIVIKKVSVKNSQRPTPNSKGTLSSYLLSPNPSF